MTDSTWNLLTNPEDPRHGSPGAYTNHGCRCHLCTAANSAAVREARARRAESVTGEVPHGTEGGYSNWLCRCTECRHAYNAAVRERRARQKGLR